MTKKKLVIELVFDEIIEDEDFDPWTRLELTKIKRLDSTTLTDGQIDRLGEEIGQTDRWQVDNWILLQQVLGESDTKSVKAGRRR
mgnify:CR=1 FL=1